MVDTLNERRGDAWPRWMPAATGLEMTKPPGDYFSGSVFAAGSRTIGAENVTS